MRFLCRIGMHRWSYSTQLLDEPDQETQTEIILARCTRDGCARYGSWSLVHREARLAGAPAPAANGPAPDSPASLA